MIAVGIGVGWIFANDVHGPEMTFAAASIISVAARPRPTGSEVVPHPGQRTSPFQDRPTSCIPGVLSQSAHVAGSLDVVLAAQGQDSVPCFPIWPEINARLATAWTLSVPEVCWVIPME